MYIYRENKRTDLRNGTINRTFRVLFQHIVSSLAHSIIYIHFTVTKKKYIYEMDNGVENKIVSKRTLIVTFQRVSSVADTLEMFSNSHVASMENIGMSRNKNSKNKNENDLSLSLSLCVCYSILATLYNSQQPYYLYISVSHIQ